VPRIGGVLGPNGRYLPELVVEIGVESHEPFEVTAVVDSGADMTIFPAEDLEAHEILFADMSYASTGKGVGDGCEFEIRSCEGTVKWKTWEFAETLYVAEPGAFEKGLLGREDFFAAFSVNFAGWTARPPSMVIEHYPRRRA
jgi:hypothetical protein